MGLILRVLGSKAGPWVLLGIVVAFVGLEVFLLNRAHNRGYEQGQTAERQSWQKVAERARLLSDQLAAERQARKDDAAASRAERDRLYATRVQPITLEVRDYAKSHAAATRCVDPVGLRLGQQAVAAANAAIAGDSGGSK